MTTAFVIIGLIGGLGTLAVIAEILEEANQRKLLDDVPPALPSSRNAEDAEL